MCVCNAVSIYLFVCLSVNLFIYLSAYLTICLSAPYEVYNCISHIPTFCWWMVPSCIEFDSQLYRIQLLYISSQIVKSHCLLQFPCKKKSTMHYSVLFDSVSYLYIYIYTYLYIPYSVQIPSIRIFVFLNMKLISDMVFSEQHPHSLTLPTVKSQLFPISTWILLLNSFRPLQRWEKLNQKRCEAELRAFKTWPVDSYDSTSQGRASSSYTINRRKLVVCNWLYPG